MREGLRFRASASRAFRLPTYTDLYYSDPANLGNPLLKPESAWSFETGPEWNPGGRVYVDLTLFYRREHNDIDYVKYALADPWQATNVSNLAFTGVESSVRLKLLRSQEIRLSYTGLQASQREPEGVISKYVFNFPSQNAAFTWLDEFKGAVVVRTRVGVIQRFGQDAYPLWDVAASRTRGLIRPYLQLSNLSNTGYQEIPGVSMPGRSVIVGAEMVLSGKERRE